jgi:cytochrome b
MALRTAREGLKLPMRVWDAPTRLFHWVLILLIAGSYTSISLDYIRLHLVFGFTIAALLLFRIAWGFVGSDTARFRNFVRNPIEGLRHLAQFPRREPDTEVGHNAAGGWMILLMLVVLIVQVLTGMCSNDDGGTEGPLAKYVGKANSDWLSGIHGLNFYVLLALMALHVVAIIAYAVVKRHDLVRPMITGKKRLPAATRAPRMASPVLAVVLLAIAGGAVWVLATRV